MSEKAKIIIEDATWSKLDGADSRTMSKLNSAMSFMNQKNFWAAGGRQKTSGWSGYVRFFDKEDGSFLTGLVPVISQALEDMNVPHEICRLKTCPLPVALNEDLLSPSVVRPRGCDLREDQVEFIRRMVEHRRGLVKAATGFGKTAVMAAYLKLIPPKTLTVIVINSTDLIAQTIKAFTEYGVDPESIGWIYGGKRRGRYIMITTAMSLHHLDELLPHVRVLITDEAHYGVTTNKVVREFRKMTRAMDRFAFSATPWKKDQVHNYKLRGHFGIQLGDVPLFLLQEMDILAKGKCRFLTVDHPDADYEADYDKAYREYIVGNTDYHERVAALVTGFTGRTLINVEWKDHGQALHERIPGSIWVCGEDKRKIREEIVEKLRTAPNDCVVIATKIFGTGLDIYIHQLVNAGGGQGEIKVKQLYGRGVRKSEDKFELNYYDFIHVMNKHLKRHSKRRIKHMKSEYQQVEITDEDQ
jgi:superfamily II DNA or RNA helicase